MPTVERLPVAVRPANSDDINVITAFDHSYSTDYVWQMDLREEHNQINTTFRQIRLPRSVRVMYPRSRDSIRDIWTTRRLFIVAEVDRQVRGYLSVAEATVEHVGWVAEFAVERKSRRGGIGSALIASAADWAQRAGMRRLLVEVQTKNYPAICFCQKHGFAFCGYNDHHFANQDIALYFGMSLK